MLNETEERFHPKQWSSTNIHSAQKKKETNKTPKPLNKVYFMKGFKFWKTNVHKKETPRKQSLLLLDSSMDNILWALLTIYKSFKKIGIITDG